MNRKVWGGAGLDRLVKFGRPDTAIWSAFAIRNESETYSLRLCGHKSGRGGFVASLYRELGSLLSEHYAQWYFLHEEIPFVT